MNALWARLLVTLLEAGYTPARIQRYAPTMLAAISLHPACQTQAMLNLCATLYRHKP